MNPASYGTNTPNGTLHHTIPSLQTTNNADYMSEEEFQQLLNELTYANEDGGYSSLGFDQQNAQLQDTWSGANAWTASAIAPQGYLQMGPPDPLTQTSSENAPKRREISRMAPSLTLSLPTYDNPQITPYGPVSPTLTNNVNQAH